MIGGVVIYVCITVVQGDTMRPRDTIIRVEDSEVDFLFTHLAHLLHTFYTQFTHLLHTFWDWYILPRHHPYVGHLKSMCCPIIFCPAGSRGTSMVPFGGIDAGWKPGGSKIDEKLSLLLEDSAPSSSEDMFTTAGYREVTCMRRA